MKKKKISRRKAVNIAAVSMLVAALVLGLLLRIMEIESVRIWYEGIQQLLIDFENAILAIENKHIVLLVILAIFVTKALIPFVPISTVCFITGMVFPGVKGFVINMAGICIQMIIAFFRGRFFGGGNVHKLLNKYEGTRQILEKKTSTHALLLFAFRIVPFTPMNTVSRLYGSMEIGFWEYLLISMGGFAPRVVSYTMMGRNVFDPLSPSFIVPIIVLLVISGVSALILNLILDRAAKNTKEKTGEKA